MKYTKRCLTPLEQADLLMGRGMQADRDMLARRLGEVSYYRLTGYWYPFRMTGREEFEEGTRFEAVWDRYVFDRQLRVVTMDAIERVEIALRTALIQELTDRHGPFAHVDRTNLPKIPKDRHRDLMLKIRQEAQRSHEVFVKHFERKYTSEIDLPLWMAAELMTFGSMLSLYRGSAPGVQQAVAARYGVADVVLDSWLVGLNTVRNICAHHARLWDRTLGTPFKIPRMNKHPEWHRPGNVSYPPRSVFTTLSVLIELLRVVAPQSGWRTRLVQLWDAKHPQIPMARMGFPPNWRESAIWREGTP